MNNEKQTQLITEIGEMIIDDYISQNIDWHSLGFVVTLDGSTRRMTGFEYYKDGSFEASLPSEAGDIVRKCRVLKEEMINSGDSPFLQCLIQITKPNYELKFQFEYENPKKWVPKSLSMDMSDFANLLRPL